MRNEWSIKDLLAPNGRSRFLFLHAHVPPHAKEVDVELQIF